MPTGYTADIAKGISFEEFVWNCARAFGALVLMRDDPQGAPIPERLEPSPYYAESVKKDEAELARLHSLTKEQANAECLAAYQRQMESYNQRRTERRELREKYLRMLAKVKEWTPPTPKHAGLREFMEKQITQSIEWDCSDKYDRPPICRSTEAWLADSIEKARQSLTRSQQSHAEEVERTESRNRWLAALRESVPYQEKRDA
jgi:hypothetical protein